MVIISDSKKAAFAERYRLAELARQQTAETPLVVPEQAATTDIIDKKVADTDTPTIC